jgi:hypothetical protein
MANRIFLRDVIPLKRVIKHDSKLVGIPTDPLKIPLHLIVCPEFAFVLVPLLILFKMDLFVELSMVYCA